MGQFECTVHCMQCAVQLTYREPVWLVENIWTVAGNIGGKAKHRIKEMQGELVLQMGIRWGGEYRA